MIRRCLVSLVAVLLLSFDGWACSDIPQRLHPLVCSELGSACSAADDCCSMRCVACGESPIGICVDADGGVQ
jgi:hypothetical protein